MSAPEVVRKSASTVIEGEEFRIVLRHQELEALQQGVFSQGRAQLRGWDVWLLQRGLAEPKLEFRRGGLPRVTVSAAELFPA